MSKFKIGDVVRYIGTAEKNPYDYYVARHISEHTDIGMITKVDVSCGSGRLDAFTEEELEKDWTYYDVKFSPVPGKPSILKFIKTSDLNFVDIDDVKESNATRNQYYPFFDNNYEWYKKNWPELAEALEKQVIPLDVLPEWIRYTDTEINEMVPRDFADVKSLDIHGKIYYRDDKSGNNDKLFYEGTVSVMVSKFLPSERGYVYRRGLVSIFLSKDKFPTVDETLFYQVNRFVDTSPDTNDELVLQFMTKEHLHGNGQLKEEYISSNPFIVELYKPNEVKNEN